MTTRTFFSTITDHTSPMWLQALKILLLVKTVLLLLTGQALAFTLIIDLGEVLGFLVLTIMVWIVVFMLHIIDMVLLHHLANVRAIRDATVNEKKSHESKGGPKRLLNRSHEEAS